MSLLVANMAKQPTSKRFAYRHKAKKAGEPTQIITIQLAHSRLAIIDEAAEAAGISRASFIATAAYDRAATYLASLAAQNGTIDPLDVLHKADIALQSYRAAFGSAPPVPKK